MTNKVWLIFLAIFLLLLSSCASEPVPNEQEPPTQTEPVDQIESPSPSLSPWSEEEITVLSKMVWGEARGIPSDTEKAACVWCALNRVDYGYGNIVMVVTAPYQFAGYDVDNPIDDEIKALCENVLTRWYAEKSGETDVGRVLPLDYMWFTGDGERNYFRNAYEGGQTWDWSLQSPYES